MVAWAINHNGPVAIRYPKAVLEPDLNNRFGKDRLPIELGHCEPLLDGQDGLIIGCGSLAGTCLRAVDELREEGLHVGLINARFVKPFR
jgi:1-deoxy-D-xylulose-5-phosphate synthase